MTKFEAYEAKLDCADPAERLRSTGLAIERPLLPDDVGRLKSALQPFTKGGLMRVRPWFVVNLLEYGDVRRQQRLHDVTVGHAEARVWSRATTLHYGSEVTITTPDFPRRHGGEGMVLLDLSDASRTVTLYERNDITHALESLNPEEDGPDYEWRPKSPAIVLGTLVRRHTRDDQQEVAAALQAVAPPATTFVLEQAFASPILTMATAS